MPVATLRERLTSYAAFRATEGEVSGQGEVDRALAALRRAPGRRVPQYGGVGRPELLYRITVQS
ncbi:hypothetical protein ACIBH1_22745 [Nonomuraea sp. NPDC050663]|uniref:hypothetical protein n=1 Tax=Nonomuraea sp. NPDC050663 TaxID=3364370 RepID=UPI00379B8C80